MASPAGSQQRSQTRSQASSQAGQQQPDFQEIAANFHNIRNEIVLMGNLQAMNDRQAADARHQQLVDLITNSIAAINTRLDGIDRTLAMK